MFALLVRFTKLDEAYYQPEADEVLASDTGFAEGNINGAYFPLSFVLVHR